MQIHMGLNFLNRTCNIPPAPVGQKLYDFVKRGAFLRRKILYLRRHFRINFTVGDTIGLQLLQMPRQYFKRYVGDGLMKLAKTLAPV